MLIRLTATMLVFGGVMLWLVTKFDPFLYMLGMDYVAIFMMAGGVFILLFFFPVSGTSKQYDVLPVGASLINFIRRDGMLVPLVGRRVFSGESFLDIPRLGLIEDLGKDTVFSWGRKRVRFGLENINYTPDPRYFNLCAELYRLGFDDSDDLDAVLNIPSMDASRDKAMKTYYLDRMARIYWNMKHPPLRGGERLVRGFSGGFKHKVRFGHKRENTMIGG